MTFSRLWCLMVRTISVCTICTSLSLSTTAINAEEATPTNKTLGSFQRFYAEFIINMSEKKEDEKTTKHLTTGKNSKLNDGEKQKTKDLIDSLVGNNADRLKGIVLLFGDDEETNDQSNNLNIPKNEIQADRHISPFDDSPSDMNKLSHTSSAGTISQNSSDSVPCHDPKCDEECRTSPRCTATCPKDLNGVPCDPRSVLWSHESLEGKAYITKLSALSDILYQRPSVKNRISPFDYNKQGDRAININFTPFKILSVNELEQSISIASYVSLEWNDDALRWHPEDFDNIRSIDVKTDNIWTPSIILPRANGDGFQLRKPNYVRANVDNANNMKLSTLFKFTISCPLDLTKFPFDTQVCSIMFQDENCRPMNAMSLDNNNSNSDTLNTLDDDTSGEWDIVDKGVEVAENEKGIKIEVSHQVVYKITLKRRSMFYIANLLIPVYMTSFVALFVFWIPPETGEKVSFMVSIYVSTAMYNSVMDKTMPHSLATIPAYNVITVSVNIQIALTFVASLLVLRQYTNQVDAENNMAASATTTEKTVSGPATATTPLPLGTPKSKSSSSSSSSSSVLCSIQSVQAKPSLTSITSPGVTKYQRPSDMEAKPSLATITSPGVTKYQRPSDMVYASNKPNVLSESIYIKRNGAATMDDHLYPQQCWSKTCPVASSYDEDDHLRPTRRHARRTERCFDYKTLDKLFFVAFTIGFFAILIVPWLTVTL